ncbi:MAG: FAD-dependent monooxygenase [Polyangiales bacterium]
MNIEDVDVAVVGAGPTGMTAAGDLARLGRKVVVFERWPTPNPSSRAFATMPRTLEVLDSRGLADELLPLGQPTSEVRLFGRTKLDLTQLRSRYRSVFITPQTNVDQVLGRYAVAQGAQVHRGWELVALEEAADGVSLTTRPKDSTDAAEHKTFRARYVVGADGAHSTVRRLLGIAFPGKAVLSSVVLADVKLTRGPTGGLTLGTTPACFGFLVPYGRHDADGSWYRSMTWDRRRQVDDHEPVSDDEIRGVLREAMGRDVGVVDISWHSRFHCDERQVDHYRHGRVFLAGDAAHVHSPIGGQGMNTGIQDAANLAWKIDAALSGADDAVLDTYHAERHPIGRRVLLQSGLMMRGVVLRPRPARWVRDHLAPLLLNVPRVRDLIAGSFAGTELRYGHTGHAGIEHRLVGTRATEVPLSAERLTVLQRQPGFVLIRERGSAPLDAANALGVLQAERTDDGPALLVRPDGYVAWAGVLGEDSPAHSWRSAFRRWTGVAIDAAVRSAA